MQYQCPPTFKQKKAEDAIRRMTAANNGVSPSIVELSAELGVSENAVRQLIRGLCARGRLRRRHGIPRSLQLIPEKEAAA